jgi:ABC-type proline/glycine betaine transport system ATPase subunit
MTNKPPAVLLGKAGGGNAAIQQMANELIEYRKGGQAHLNEIYSLKQ